MGNDRTRIPLGIAPSGNECRPVCPTFLTDWYLWILSLWCLLFRLHSSVFSFRTENRIFLLFPCSLLAYIVLEAARTSSRTFSLQSQMMTLAIIDRLLCIPFKSSCWVSFPGCFPLKSLSSLRALKLSPLICCSTQRQTISIENNLPLLFSGLCPAATKP